MFAGGFMGEQLKRNRGLQELFVPRRSSRVFVKTDVMQYEFTKATDHSIIRNTLKSQSLSWSARPQLSGQYRQNGASHRSGQSSCYPIDSIALTQFRKHPTHATSASTLVHLESDIESIRSHIRAQFDSVHPYTVRIDLKGQFGHNPMFHPTFSQRNTVHPSSSGFFSSMLAFSRIGLCFLDAHPSRYLPGYQTATNSSSATQLLGDIGFVYISAQSRNALWEHIIRGAHSSNDSLLRAYIYRSSARLRTRALHYGYHRLTSCMPCERRSAV